MHKRGLPGRAGPKGLAGWILGSGCLLVNIVGGTGTGEGCLPFVHSPHFGGQSFNWTGAGFFPTSAGGGREREGPKKKKKPGFLFPFAPEGEGVAEKGGQKFWRGGKGKKGPEKNNAVGNGRGGFLVKVAAGKNQLGARRWGKNELGKKNYSLGFSGR